MRALKVIVTIGFLLPAFVWGKTSQIKDTSYFRPVDGKGCIPNEMNNFHSVGNIYLSVSNHGFFGSQRGNDDPSYGCLPDPRNPSKCSPSCEFPGGSGIEYLFQGALWLGAVVEGETLVSLGQDGWEPVHPDLYPGCDPNNCENILLNPSASQTDSLCVVSLGYTITSEQDFIATYTDTLTDPTFANPQHKPMGIKIVQKSYAWSYDYAKNFVIFDYTFKNIRTDGKTLRNVYIGLYIDADVGHIDTPDYAQDDITGYISTYTDNTVSPPKTYEVNMAWIADNDGDPVNGAFDKYTSPTGVTGTLVLKAPFSAATENPYSFNWWISNGDEALDWGPYLRVNNRGWDGTPSGYIKKYEIMSNNEFDYPQYLIGAYRDSARWMPPPDNWRDLEDGYDTRYLFSFGPIEAIAPGESVQVVIAYIGGENFHVDPTNVSPNLDYRKYNVRKLVEAANWVRVVYDNHNVDTDGDGFGGEDVGTDGLGPWNEGYPGPDPDGTEGNGILDPGEDTFYPPNYTGPVPRFGYGNGKLDLGDGIADYKGPTPPPAPKVTYETFDNKVVLKWTDSLENVRDPVTGVRDFEGYRIYIADINLNEEYTLLASFDKIDYLARDKNGLFLDTLVYEPGEDTVLVPAPHTVPREPFGYNIGLPSYTPITDSVRIRRGVTKEYRYEITNLRSTKGRYFVVTAFDYGSPRQGLSSLESSKVRNAIYVVPSPVKGAETKVYVVPNPYRIDGNYGSKEGLWWEGDPTRAYTEYDRKIRFYNLPPKCTIRIFTLDGDLVREIKHSGGNPVEDWDLINKNDQAIVSGIYLFSVEDENKNVQVGKFVIIK